MPYEITLDCMPGGYSVNAARDGEEVLVERREFISSEDGQDFITKLEGLPDDLLRRLPPSPRVSPSQVDHLLAIIRRDKTATVYVNEQPFIVQVRAGRDIEAGTPVVKDDIGDVTALAWADPSMPAD